MHAFHGNKQPSQVFIDRNEVSDKTAYWCENPTKAGGMEPCDNYGAAGNNKSYDLPLTVGDGTAALEALIKVRSPFKNTLLNTRPMAQDKQRERGEQRMKISLESCIS